MGAFFSQSRGVVKRVTGPHPASPFFVAIEGKRTPFTAAIITQVGISQQGNFQFLHTLDDTVFAYIFGNRIGELRVSGVGFAEECNTGQVGTDQVIDWYAENKISSRGSPVIVGIGNRTFNGFCTGQQVDVADAEMQLSQWSFRFNIFPVR